MINGGGGEILVEPTMKTCNFTISRVYLAKWRKDRPDLIELKRLRESGYSYSQLAKHFTCSRPTVIRYYSLIQK